MVRERFLLPSFITFDISVSILYLDPVRFGEDPVFLLLEFLIAATHVVGNLRPALIERIVVRFGEAGIVTLGGQPGRLLIGRLHLYIGIVALVKSRLFHVASLLRCLVGYALKQPFRNLLASFGLYRKVLRYPSWAIREFRFPPTKQKAKYHVGNDVVYPVDASSSCVDT
jgi:hypothetical protein